jgi:hypothetical protein
MKKKKEQIPNDQLPPLKLCLHAILLNEFDELYVEAGNQTMKNNQINPVSLRIKYKEAVTSWMTASLRKEIYFISYFQQF